MSHIARVRQKETDQKDHTLHTRLTDSELTEANLLGAAIYGTDDTKIGRVAHVHGILSGRAEFPKKALMATGGGSAAPRNCFAQW